ncbi:MAG: type II secretion system protein [Candidatus Colwellbacteria bacterium]|nr:type II secretion system protein [Candidatus Colwellbacteria bacterium]
MSISASLNSKKGFTLIEMVITISLIGFLLSITATSGGSSKRQFLLTTSQEHLRALLSRAKFLSVGTTFSGSGQTVCGYGVHVDKSGGEAFIFRDLPAGFSCPGDFRYSGDTREKITGFLNVMKLDSALSFSIDADVVFIPPDPTTVLQGDAAVPEIEETISIAGGDSRRIKINKAGLIDLITK